MEQLNFRSSNINLNDALDHLDPLAPGGIGGGRGPMDGPWGGGGGAGPLGPQRRGPPPPVDDHFDLGLGVGPGGPMGMGPPPQPRGGFPPNPTGFSGANSIMNNVGNSGAALNQGILARLLNSQQQPNNQPHFNPVSHFGIQAWSNTLFHVIYDCMLFDAKYSCNPLKTKTSIEQALLFNLVAGPCSGK